MGIDYILVCPYTLPVGSQGGQNHKECAHWKHDDTDRRAVSGRSLQGSKDLRGLSGDAVMEVSSCR